MKRIPSHDQSLLARFSASYTPVTESGCWLWDKSVAKNGYGKVYFKMDQYWAHRVSYELFVGPIPNGLCLDHLCRVRCCVNPYHLEPVTTRENNLRGVGISAFHASKQCCKRGHKLTASNTYIPPSRAERVCRVCAKIRSKKLTESRRAKRNAHKIVNSSLVAI